VAREVGGAETIPLGGSSRHLRTVIVATDGSACADRAVEVAASLAKDGGATLLILTVGGNVGNEVRAIAVA
jgi:nucleotide-binding universal stress UspA family protein